jgi:hypothetical protein
MTDEDAKATKGLKREWAEGAKTLLTDVAFQEAVKRLRKMWFGQMMTDGLTQERQNELRARIMALEGVASQLDSIIRDSADAERRR